MRPSRGTLEAVEHPDTRDVRSLRSREQATGTHTRYPTTGLGEGRWRDAGASQHGIQRGQGERLTEGAVGCSVMRRAQAPGWSRRGLPGSTLGRHSRHRPTSCIDGSCPAHSSAASSPSGSTLLPPPNRAGGSGLDSISPSFSGLVGGAMAALRGPDLTNTIWYYVFDDDEHAADHFEYGALGRSATSSGQVDSDQTADGSPLAGAAPTTITEVYAPPDFEQPVGASPRSRAPGAGPVVPSSSGTSKSSATPRCCPAPGGARRRRQRYRAGRCWRRPPATDRLIVTMDGVSTGARDPSLADSARPLRTLHFPSDRRLGTLSVHEGPLPEAPDRELGS